MFCDSYFLVSSQHFQIEIGVSQPMQVSECGMYGVWVAKAIPQILSSHFAPSYLQRNGGIALRSHPLRLHCQIRGVPRLRTNGTADASCVAPCSIELQIDHFPFGATLGFVVISKSMPGSFPVPHECVLADD